MSKKNKNGPTWYDVGEAKRQGIRIALVSCLTVLRDKNGFSDEDIVKFENDFIKLQEEIQEGRVNAKDLQKVQNKEYNTRFV